MLAAATDEHGRWVHLGLTSSDVLDTALAVQLQEAGSLLLDRVASVFAAVQQLAVAHRDTPIVGRTHGMWAEPTTFGHKVAGFGFGLVDAADRLRWARGVAGYGKVSGPVGNHSTVPPSVEDHVMGALGLQAQPAATQVVGRDRHATFLLALAVVGATLERFATEVRHLQRSEVAEVAEHFSAEQKGSSAMPHKRNPVLSENVTGMARLLRGYAATSVENVALWHERDISHSSVERVAIPDACHALNFALARMERIITGLSVHADRMLANLAATNGTVFSQAILLALIREGMERDAAYRVVQDAADRTAASGEHLRDVLGADEACPLSAEQLAGAFDLGEYLSHAGTAVDRLAEISPESVATGSPTA